MRKSVVETCAASAEIANRETWPQTDGIQPEIVVRLDLVGDVVRLIRAIECGGESVVEVEAWRSSHESLEQAADTYEALSSREDEFAYLSVGALVFGPEWVTQATTGMVEKFIWQRNQERERVARELEKERVRLEEEQEAETSISVYFREKKGAYLLTLERGSNEAEPVWSISFEESWERDRFWDWLGWQNERFEEFAEFMRDGSRLDLERRLLREMLVTEQSVKKQGLGSGGRRPLRFWRGEL